MKSTGTAACRKAHGGDKMALQKPAAPFGQYRWRWLLVMFGFFSWISLGCNPATLSMLMIPWVDNKLDPEYKLFAEGKELTLVIVSNFASPQLQPDLQPAEMELAEKLSSFLRKRCVENKHKIKIVPYAEVRSYQVKQWVDGNPSPLDIGKKFKADFVLDLNIQSMSLYEKRAVTPLFRGETEITINLYKVNATDGDHKVYNKDYRGEGAPTPFDAGTTSAATFRGMFLTKVSRDISKLFIAYPPEERVPFDHSSGVFNTR
jgi:hypothetical protein